MGDLASDHDAAIELIIEEYGRLYTHNSEHELLKYITNISSEGFEYVSGEHVEFLDRFETSEDKKLDYIKVAKVLGSYFVALRNAVDEIEGIDRTPKRSVDVTPIKSLDKFEYKQFPEGDIPF